MSRLTRLGYGVMTAIVVMLMNSITHAQPFPSDRLSVVELFTSQGCSSCPPADAVLGELAKRPEVLALAFHVDYWDGLGWRDRFAIPEAVQRQRRYTQALRLSTAFTPQAVIDGQHSRVGSDRRGIAALIDSPRDGIPIKLLVANNTLSIILNERAESGPLDVSVVAYLPRSSTPVGRGENAGRMLDEFNIVRAFKSLGTWQGRAKQFHVSLSTLPTDASRVAVLLQQPGQGAIVGAAVANLR